MTTQNLAMEQKKQVEPIASKLLNDFSLQLSRLNNSLEELENTGHRIANTNFPKPDEQKPPTAAMVQSDGILSDVEIKINKLSSYNSRFEELVKKLSELI